MVWVGAVKIALFWNIPGIPDKVARTGLMLGVIILFPTSAKFRGNPEQGRILTEQTRPAAPVRQTPTHLRGAQL